MFEAQFPVSVSEHIHPVLCEEHFLDEHRGDAGVVEPRLGAGWKRARRVRRLATVRSIVVAWWQDCEDLVGFAGFYIQ